MTPQYSTTSAFADYSVSVPWIWFPILKSAVVVEFRQSHTCYKLDAFDGLAIALRRNPGIYISEAIPPLTLPGWRKLCGGQPRTWLGTIKADAEVISGPYIYGVQRWKRDWLHNHAGARYRPPRMIRDVVHNEAGSTPTPG